MTRHPKFTLIFAPEALEHLDTVEHKHHSLIRKTIHEQLCYTPQKETRNRKPLEQPAPFGATWELRFGPKNCFRVFYEIDTATQSVSVLAVGLKRGNRLFIGRKEFEL
jgi:mRNA-degrading endonuclease RelE of RelBE toxin-antitoxin system